MTPKELAAALDGREYLNETTNDLEHAALTHGLVIVFGASDDLLEMRGAINEEVGAWGGRIVMIDVEGLVPGFSVAYDDGREEVLENYFRRKNDATLLEAIWDKDGYSWIYQTGIPHETFDILEDGDKYCRGIVFALADVPKGA